METNHSLSNNLGKNNTDEYDSQSFISENYSVLAVSMVVLTSILAFISCWLREACYDRCGVEVCSGSISTARRREIRRNQIRAIQLQRQMERDLQESSLAKQEERKRIYGEFLQKFSRVLTEGDIAVEEVDEAHAALEPTRSLRFCPHDRCKEHIVVEAVCIICFRDYETGDHVVWSSNETCRHIYHMECLLKWLSTGKKKCPICRVPFVPNNCSSSDGAREQTEGGTSNGSTSDQPDQGSEPISTEPGQGLDSV